MSALGFDAVEEFGDDTTFVFYDGTRKTVKTGSVEMGRIMNRAYRDRARNASRPKIDDAAFRLFRALDSMNPNWRTSQVRSAAMGKVVSALVELESLYCGERPHVRSKPKRGKSPLDILICK